jgi:hypothetical protein
MPCYPPALQIRGGNCQPVTLDNLNFSFLSRFRTTGDKHLRNTWSGAEKDILDFRACVIGAHLQYLRGHGRQVQQKMTNAMQ